MAKPLSFMDCPHCSKRIRTDAVLCHHCQQPPTARRKTSRSRDRRDRDSDLLDESDESPDEDSEGHDAHYAQSIGGYDAADDFDYDEFVAEEFGSGEPVKKASGIRTWIWITAWVLIILTLIPFLIPIFIALGG
ncbi:MAG: hypothetical protein U0892_21930 [Pirellulales bacterium]